jgi:hypothetical protein
MVTGLFLLFGAIVPKSVQLLGALFGTDYGFTVVGILAVFIVTIAFHFSLAFSKHERNQQKLAQRCAELESRLQDMETGRTRQVMPSCLAVVSEPELSISTMKRSDARGPRIAMPGPYLLVLFVIGFSFLATLLVGLVSGKPMIGDEVTHYYMLEHQAETLFTPVFRSTIPVGWGDAEIRGYPHVNGWHYIGAWVYRLTGRKFGSVQLYQSLFWLQFLLAAGWLARRRNGKESRVPVLYVLLLATLPVATFFSVALYQDVPAAAQILMAFALAFYGHWVSGLVFMLLALSLKVTSFLFIPPFFVVVLLNGYKGWVPLPRSKKLKSLLTRAVIVGVCLLVCSFGWDWTLKHYAQSRYYPLKSIDKTLERWALHFQPEKAEDPSGATGSSLDESGPSSNDRPALVVTAYEKEVIANHPGDLRIPKNYFIYGGGVLWLVLLLGVGWRLCEFAGKRKHEAFPGSLGLWLTGLAYVIPVAYLLRTSPDARFFLPAIPFLLLPLVEWVGRSPKIRVTASVLAALAILQVGHVYAKVYELRSVSKGVQAAIHYLEKNPPAPPRIFMYPEGNYRFFPVPVDWYLQYWLRDFWEMDNDGRLEILQRGKIGAIVIKKHLIGMPDENYTDLGIYPVEFVKDIAEDARFRNVFENDQVVIYEVPQKPPGD